MSRPREWWTGLVHDLRYGLRTLRRSPFFTTVALVTLALGIGATTAVFSLIDVLILRDLPVRDPARLVQFTWTYPGDPPLNLFSVENYEQYRDRNSVFSDVLGTASSSRVRVESQTPGPGADALRVECVTGNFFSALGVRSAAGRLLEDRDNGSGEPAVAVVSWTYWNRRFSRAPEVLGTSVTVLGDVSVAVVGVADRSFSGLVVGYAPDIWVPLGVCQRKGAPGLSLMARLREGASIDRARAEMRGLDRSRIETFARRDPQWREVVFDVLPARAGLATPLHHQFAKPLSILLAVLGVLLLLACANIGGLLLARGAARQRDLAVRVSLGAGRLRIVRQLLTESLLLAFAGGLLGIVGAYLGAGVLLRITTSGTRLIGIPPRLDVTLDVRVLTFATVIATLAALVFGLIPALAAFPSDPAKALRDG